MTVGPQCHILASPYLPGNTSTDQQHSVVEPDPGPVALHRTDPVVLRDSQRGEGLVAHGEWDGEPLEMAG